MREQMVEAYKRGWSLIPLKPNSKLPNLPKGHRFLYHKPSKEDYKGFEFGNYGVVCGKVSGITVLDVDMPSGMAELNEREITQSELYTPMAQTPRGFHFFFKYNPKVKTGVAVLGNGVDVRNDGSYIVGAGSKVDGKEYKWMMTPEEVEYMDPPEWLVRGRNRRIDVQPETFSEPIGDGERNNKLVSLCGILRERGKFPVDVTEVAVQAINDYWCRPPLPREEVEHLVRNNYKNYG